MEALYGLTVDTGSNPPLQGAQGWDFTSFSLVPLDPPAGDPPPTQTPESSSLLVMGAVLVGLGLRGKKWLSRPR
jgi:hypothetical protein